MDCHLKQQSLLNVIFTDEREKEKKVQWLTTSKKGSLTSRHTEYHRQDILVELFRHDRGYSSNLCRASWSFTTTWKRNMNLRGRKLTLIRMTRGARNIWPCDPSQQMWGNFQNGLFFFFFSPLVTTLTRWGKLYMLP